MQTSKTDQMMIEQRVWAHFQHLSFREMQVVRNTSSAHIAVDRKHYLHYKHFSIAETFTEMRNGKCSWGKPC